MGFRAYGSKGVDKNRGKMQHGVRAYNSNLPNLESWWEAHLRQSSDNDEPHDGYRQRAIVGLMMGDTNAVSVLEMAHGRQFINAGVLHTDSLQSPERPLPQGNEFGDEYIDDLVLFSILHFSRLNELKHCLRAAQARMCGQLSMPTAQSEGAAGVRAEFWDGAHGIAGTLGIPISRRTSLVYVTLTGAVLGVARTSLQQLLGAWMKHHAVSTLPSWRHACFLRVAIGALLDGQLLLCGIGPLLQADLRTSPRLQIFATDATPVLVLVPLQ